MEKVENPGLPRIEIYCSTQTEKLARLVGYGIEEEGLPYAIIVGERLWTEVYEACQGPGLGVTILVWEGSVSVYTRQLQEKRPLFDLAVGDDEGEKAKNIGKNSARIVKNKPFLGLEEDQTEEHRLEEYQTTEDQTEEHKNTSGGNHE